MRNVFLFIRSNFNFLFFLVLQITSLSFLFRYNKFHEAAFMNASTEITGRVNAKFNNVEYYFQLKKTNDSLVSENRRLHQAMKDNYEAPDSLRRLFRDTIRTDSGSLFLKFNYMEAKVVGNNTSSQTNYLTIHRGASGGVKPNIGVVSPQGIVGTVINVSEHYATVMTMLNRQFRAVVKLKKGGDRGTIEWDGVSPLYMTLKNIPRSAVVNKGDTVLTSQITPTYPPNVMVGTVAEVVDDNSSNFYTLKIRPATNFYSVEYVYVVEILQNEEQKKLEDSTRKKFQ